MSEDFISIQWAGIQLIVIDRKSQFIIYLKYLQSVFPTLLSALPACLGWSIGSEDFLSSPLTAGVCCVLTVFVRIA